MRALETRGPGRVPADDDGPQGREDSAEVASVPDERDADVDGLGAALSEAEARADGAEAALVQVRDEADRRLDDARAAIERERQQRTAVEQRLEQAQEELARRRAELEERERDLSEQLAQTERVANDELNREEELGEEEKQMRERWVRWQVDAQREAERRVAELAEAERRIAAARAALDEAQDAAHGTSPGEPPRVELPTPEEAATETQPAAGRRPPGRVRRLLGRRSAQPAACATCGRAFAGDGAEEAAGRWEVGLRGGAICPQCQAEGWHYPDGALVPVRGASATSRRAV